MRKIREMPFISIVLVVVNAIIFLICTFTGNMLYNIGELSPDTFWGDGQYYRLISAMFLHADISHLVNNMLLLAGLGAMLEKETGHIRFLMLYFLSGLGGQVVSLAYKIFNGEWYVASIGASGAVFGLVGVLLAMSFAWTRQMENVTWQRVLFVVAYSVYSGVRAANIDNAAHIGGFLAGFVLGLVMCLLQRLHTRRLK
ncbi:MAG: rhomboid family intramembrane serine protease [Lachnospiraceae bacterium]